MDWRRESSLKCDGALYKQKEGPYNVSYPVYLRVSLAYFYFRKDIQSNETLMGHYKTKEVTLYFLSLVSLKATSYSYYPDRDNSNWSFRTRMIKKECQGRTNYIEAHAIIVA
jgi:hypothetical protein